MSKIFPTYLIHENTFALIPGKSMDYETIVLESDQKRYVHKTALEIIEYSCTMLDWVNYESRRRVTMLHTNFKQKVPIPVSILKKIYFFPTHSPKHIDNIWLAYKNILDFQSMQDVSDQPQTIVRFINGESLILNISFHTLQSQMNRTFQIMHQIETMN